MVTTSTFMLIKKIKKFQQGFVSHFLTVRQNETKHCFKVESKMTKLHHYLLLEFEDLLAYIHGDATI
jgi:hypothetical protein